MDANTEWLAQPRTGAATYRQRQSPKQRRHGRHHDGPEAQQAGLINGFVGRQMFASFGFQSEIYHHNSVLLHDTDQQNDSDQRDYAQIQMKELQGEDRAYAR